MGRWKKNNNQKDSAGHGAHLHHRQVLQVLVGLEERIPCSTMAVPIAVPLQYRGSTLLDAGGAQRVNDGHSHTLS